MNTNTQLRKHVEQMNSLFSSQGQVHPGWKLLLDFGKDYAPENQNTKPPLKNKLCFMNSWMAMDNDLAYCEGVATTTLQFPMDHAWLVDGSGKVTDLTWDHGQKYYGVAFDQDFMFEIADRTGYYGVFQSLYRLKMAPEACYEYLKTGVKHAF